MDAFFILGIEQTKDEAAIKAAYYEKVRFVNPEDDAQGFMRLRKAYEEAMQYAKRPEQMEEESEDTTASGVWIKEVATVYEALSTRRNIEEWQKLFASEIFLSLEEEEICKEKLLVFLMDHVYLPSEVWNLIDEKVHIINGDKNLLERFPREFIEFCKYKCTAGEDIDFSLFCGENDNAVEQYISCMQDGFRMLEENELEAARQLLNQGKSLALYHPLFDVLEMQVLKAEGNVEAFEKLRSDVLSQYSENVYICTKIAELSYDAGETELAKTLYERIKTFDKDDYIANYRLAFIYYEKECYKESKKCINAIAKHGLEPEISELQSAINTKLIQEYREASCQGDEMLDFAWCLFQEELFNEGTKVAEALLESVEKDRENNAKLLLYRFYIMSAKVHEAIEAALLWREEMMNVLPRLSGKQEAEYLEYIEESYSLCINGYRMLGHGEEAYYKKALHEIDALVAFMEEKVPNYQISPRLQFEKAHILFDAGLYEACEKICEELWTEYNTESIFTLLVRIALIQGNGNGVIEYGKRCIVAYPQYRTAYVNMAWVYLCLDMKEELKGIIDCAREAGIQSYYLDAYEYQMIHGEQEFDRDEALDRFVDMYKSPIVDDNKVGLIEEGERAILECFYKSPSTYTLNELGRFYIDIHRFEDAQRAFEEILVEEPWECFAYNNLGRVYKITERYEEALVLHRKAILYMDTTPIATAYSNMASVYACMGDYEEAAYMLEQMMEQFPEYLSTFTSTYARYMSKAGKLKEAKEYLNKLSEEEYSISAKCSTGAFICTDAEDEKGAFYYLKQYEQVLGADRSFTEEHLEYVWRYGHLLLRRNDYYQALAYLVHACWLAKGLAIKGEIDYALMCGYYADTLFYFTLVRSECSQDVGVGEFRIRDDNYAGQIVSRATIVTTFGLDDYCTICKELAYDLQQTIAIQHGKEVDAFWDCLREMTWMRFMASYWLEDGETEGLLENIAQCNMCTYCSENVCLQLYVAQGLFLEWKGMYKEAKQVYEQLLKQSPQDYYSRVKLEFWLDK